jgi:hypothetical protein
MKIKEFISELTVGRYASGGVVPSKPGAAVRKNSKIAYDIVKSVNAAATSKEKIEILSNLTAGNTANKIVIVGPDGERYTFRSYDKDSEKLTVSLSTSPKIYTTDVNSLEFLGKERSVSTTLKKWLFKTDNLEVQGKVEPKQDTAKKGRPAKPTYTMPDKFW